MSDEREYPNQDYYPSAKVKLVVRFDELGRRVFSGKIPPKPTKWLAGVKDKKAPLKIVPDAEAGGSARRYKLELDESKPPLPGVSPAKKIKGDDGLTHALVIVPKDVQWSQNGLRTADTLNVTIKFIDMPIDPRAIRSCAIEYFLGTVTEEEYRSGISGEVRSYEGADGTTTRTEPMHLVADEYIDSNGAQRSNLRFQGFVDKWAVAWEDGEPVIRLECRDMTQLLIDTEAPAKLMVDGSRPLGGIPGTSTGGTGMPLDEAIATYLSHFVQFAGLVVEYRIGNLQTRNAVIPKVSQAFSKPAYRPQLGPPPATMAGAMTGLSVWDYLTDVCGALGHVIRVDGTTIIIQQGATYTSNGSVQRPDDPFDGDARGLKCRRFFYGRNILHMRSERNFTRPAQPKNVEVRCWSTKQKKLLAARFPFRPPGNPSDPLARAWPGESSEEDWTVVRVQGIEDENTLRVIAQNVYEQTGRNELTMRIKTRNLASFGGGNLDPDILDMRAGDTFEVLVHREDEERNTMSKIDNLLHVQERNAEFLRSLGFPSDFADTYAKTFVDLGFQTVFRAKTIGFGWNVDEGVTIEIEGINYIEVRADKLGIPGPEGEVTI